MAKAKISPLVRIEDREALTDGILKAKWTIDDFAETVLNVEPETFRGWLDDLAIPFEYAKKIDNFFNYDLDIFRRKKEDEASHDNVNRPAHYTSGTIEVINYIRDKLSAEQFTGFCLGNVLKYVSRARFKNGTEDLKKAEVYLKWAIENEEKKG